MTNIYFLAAEGESLPLDNPVGPLLPASYDIVWSLIPFLVILWVFWKFIIPKFQEVLAEREDRIEGGIERAEAAQTEAKAALDKYNSQLAEARQEANKIREEAREQGQKIIAEATDKANEENNRIIASGEKQLQAMREQVITDLRREMGMNSVNLAERLLGRELSDDLKKSETIDKFLGELDDVAVAGK
ncbi:F0F1 ATP synthase subunit B [Corynebacterium ulceribovis]|uniref:F0F1 ATP synthase subunit B n=1 Tax=Corynebacterium ulceribovis TaxID=487732 RepID=UPI00037F00A1|nr:F0F1 ATP synthase subunit B [Corynebacterium ulceribovis]